VEDQEDFLKALDDLSFVIGVTQHHDGISGTEKQAVSDNYAQLINEAREKVDQKVQAFLLKMNADNKISSSEMARAMWNQAPVSIFQNN
jgi:predicted RNA-binding protein Jag